LLIAAGGTNAFLRVNYNYPGGVGFCYFNYECLIPYIDQVLNAKEYNGPKRPEVTLIDKQMSEKWLEKGRQSSY